MYRRHRMSDAERCATWWTRAPWALAITLAACAVVYGFALGAGGLANSEAHRVAPAWAMLDGGGWIVPKLFEQEYLRKPPGAPWSIAATSLVFGQNAVGARAASAIAATLTALIAAGFSRRWFGPAAMLPAGLAAALMPWMWAFGRSAEIEALNQFGVALACFGAIDIARASAVSSRLGPLGASASIVGVAILLFAKGPAGVGVVIATTVAACICVRIARVKVVSQTLIAWGIGAAPFAAWVYAASQEVASDAVTQSPSAFMWSDPLNEIASFPVLAWVSAMPAALAMLFPWGGDAKAEAAGTRRTVELSIAKAVCLAWVFSVVSLVALGVGNPRYALPAAALVPPVVGYAIAQFRAGMTPKRQVIARMMLLGHGLVWPVVLMSGFFAYARFVEAPIRATSGEVAGVAFAEALRAQVDEGPVVIAADGAIEARPEVLLALQHAWSKSAGDGPRLRVVWRPGIASNPEQIRGAWLLLRYDELDDEVTPLEKWIAEEPILVRDVHRYRLTLYRSR